MNKQKAILRLRNSLAHKGYGTEIKEQGGRKEFIIKTTIFTGAISKKQVKASIELDNEFLGRGVVEQERILIKKLSQNFEN
jgi:hypothetical protein